MAAARVQKETLVGRSTDRLAKLSGDNLEVGSTGADWKAEYDTLGMCIERPQSKGANTGQDGLLQGDVDEKSRIASN